MRIYRLVLGPDREEHIARHGVSVAEANEIAYGDFVVVRTRQDRYSIIGQTEGGRYLFLVVAPRGSGVYGLVTARDATDRERRLYRRQRGR